MSETMPASEAIRLVQGATAAVRRILTSQLADDSPLDSMIELSIASSTLATRVSELNSRFGYVYSAARDEEDARARLAHVLDQAKGDPS